MYAFLTQIKIINIIKGTLTNKAIANYLYKHHSVNIIVKKENYTKHESNLNTCLKHKSNFKTFLKT